MLDGHIGRFPPHSSPLQQSVSTLAHRFVIRCIRQFLIVAKDDNRGPPIVAFDFVDLHTHERICTHAVDLVAHGGKTEKIVAVIHYIDRNNIRLTVQIATQSC